MPHNEEERRLHTRRMEDLENKYSLLLSSIESVKVKQNVTENLIQSNNLRLQDNQRNLESKVDDLKKLMTDNVSSVKDVTKSQGEDIEDLKELANRMKGSLATINFMGIASFISAVAILVKLFLLKP